MPSMSDRVSALQAQITDAAAISISPQQMVQLIDISIAEAVAKSRHTVSYSINGRSVTISSLSEARALREYYDNLAKEGSGGGIVPQFGEFC